MKLIDEVGPRDEKMSSDPAILFARFETPEDELFALEDKFSSLEKENKKLREILKTQYTLGEVEKIYMHGLMSHKPRKEPKIIGNCLYRINKYNRLCGKVKHCE
jgi:hypothetical protein